MISTHMLVIFITHIYACGCLFYRHTLHLLFYRLHFSLIICLGEPPVAMGQGWPHSF